MSEKAFDFASALDRGMNSIDDAPEYGNPANGSHIMIIDSVSQKLLGEKKSPSIIFKYKYVQPMELANPSDENLSEGGFCTETFGVSEEGLPYLKKHVKDFWDKNPELSLAQVLKNIEGQQVAITSQKREFTSNGQKREGWRSVQMIMA